MLAAILNTAILNLAIFDSSILVCPLKLTHTCQDWFPPFAQKNFTHSFWLNLMMAAILNSAKLDSDTAILNSDTLLSSLRFTQKHSHSTMTLTPTNSIWLKVIHSHLTWWWQPSCILPSWFLPSWIQPFCSKLWLQLIQSDSKSFILTQLDDGGHLGFSHFPQKTSLNHSESTWWWNPSWICPCWIQTLPSWIQTPCYLLSDSLKSTLTPLWLCLKLIQSDSKSFILTQLDDGGHLGFSHFPQKNFTQSFWINLMMEAILNLSMLDSDTAILDSNTLLSSLRFTQKHSYSTQILTRTNSIWLKLINSDLNWWWVPSCILPS